MDGETKDVFDTFTVQPFYFNTWHIQCVEAHLVIHTRHLKECNTMKDGHNVHIGQDWGTLPFEKQTVSTKHA